MATQKPQPLVFSGFGYTRECDEVEIEVTLYGDGGRVIITSARGFATGSIDSDVQEIVEALASIGETGVEYEVDDADREKIEAWLVTARKLVPA